MSLLYGRQHSDVVIFSIERKFNFDYPAEKRRDLLARVRETPARIESVCRKFPYSARCVLPHRSAGFRADS